MTDWLVPLRSGDKAKKRLIFCHYAGGSARSFREWLPYICEDYEIISVQLPGREHRISEPLIGSVPEAIEYLSVDLKKYSAKPLVLFGHSLGAIVAYELAQKLSGFEKNDLLHVFLSGRSAPSAVYRRVMLHRLADKDFIVELKKLEGTPKEFFQQSELVSFLLPLIRNDFMLAETYCAEMKRKPINVPITVYGGTCDTYANEESMLPWREETVNSFNLKMFSGGHFFINQYIKEISYEINEVELVKSERSANKEKVCL